MCVCVTVASGTIQGSRTEEFLQAQVKEERTHANSVAQSLRTEWPYLPVSATVAKASAAIFPVNFMKENVSLEQGEVWHQGSAGPRKQPQKGCHPGEG